MARKFFYVCAGIFLLALSYHLGARNVQAQAPGNSVVGLVINVWGDGSTHYDAVTANGDFYRSNTGGTSWSLVSHVFGGPTPVKPDTWGSVKARYR